jgi:hypothetical protein
MAPSGRKAKPAAHRPRIVGDGAGHRRRRGAAQHPAPLPRRLGAFADELVEDDAALAVGAAMAFDTDRHRAPGDDLERAFTA